MMEKRYLPYLAAKAGLCLVLSRRYWRGVMKAVKAGSEGRGPASGKRAGRSGCEQFQGGSSGTISAGDGGGIQSRAGAERYRRGAAGYRSGGAGDLAGRRTRALEIKATAWRYRYQGDSCCCAVQSNDVSGAYQTYRKAVNDELLARLQLERQNTLYEKGAVAKSAVEQAEDVAKNALADLEAAQEQLRTLGINKDNPSAIVDIVAPITGIITDQQVTNASGVQGLGSPNPFTISDLSYVWIICDVYENDLDVVHAGEYADIHLNAYPNQVFQGAD